MNRFIVYRLVPLITLLILMFHLDPGYSQTLPVGDPMEMYLRLTGSDEDLEHLPSFNLRPVEASYYLQGETLNTSHPWQDHPFFRPEDAPDLLNLSNFSLYSPTLLTTYNTTLPSGQNDGALWQGRGLNTSITLGGFVSYGPLKASIRPEITYSQNRDFELSQWPPRSFLSDFTDPYIYTATIDRPQRYGKDPVNRIVPGQSWIRLEYRGLTAGVSTANIWSGPAVLNPVIFSNNAPGFFHAFLGTYRPVQTPIGNLEGILLLGGLRESDYFDENENNNLRLLNGIVLNYSPKFAAGLHLGAIRSIQKQMPENGISAPDLFEVFQPLLKENFESEENPRGNLGTHQLLSIFGRWVFPSYGMEVYAEWSRNDHSADGRDFVRHPAHARAYVLGLLKKFELSPLQWLTANVELTQLEVPRLQQFRHTGSYYNNGEIIQGFTQYGQVIGAGIGPGSNSQLLSLQYYESRGMAGISLNRVVHHNDHLYQLFERGFLELSPRNHHNVEMRLGLHGIFFLPPNLEIQADLYQSKFHNYDYENRLDKFNTNLQLTLRYNLPGLRR